ncbi:MAG: kelch repeat-containing protein [Candidatus Eisenbacteria bacterium]
MRVNLRSLLVLAVLVIGIQALGPTSASAQDSPGRILMVFSVGGVLTEDGTLWQYSPSRKWQTIDEAFLDQGRETKILPLPVKAAEIDDMETWGFFKTKSGACYLYDLETNEWRELPPPPRK